MLTILGIVAIIVFAVQVYKTAAGTERNAAGWTVVTVFIGLALQFGVPLIIGIALGIYYIATGTPIEDLESEMFGMAVFISIAGIVLSIVGMYLVMKIVSRVKEEGPGSRVPPPPPTL